MRVALTDDSVLFRSGLAALLREMDMTVTFEAGDEAELLQGIAKDPPDVVILDIHLPPTQSDEGLHAAESVRRLYPGTGILLLSGYDETAYAVRLLKGGERGVGYLIKDRVDNLEVLRDSLHRVAGGGTAVDPEIIARLMSGRRREPLAQLSEQERNVLRLMAEGRSTKGIAEALWLSTKTVDKHAKNVFDKLGLLQQDQNNRRVLAVLEWLKASGSS